MTGSILFSAHRMAGISGSPVWQLDRCTCLQAGPEKRPLLSGCTRYGLLCEWQLA